MPDNDEFDFTQYSRSRNMTILALETYATEKLTIRAILREMDVELSADIRGIVYSLSMSVIRYLNTIDYLLSRHKRNIFRTQDSISLAKLRLGIYESMWLGVSTDQITSSYLSNPRLSKILLRISESDFNQLFEKLPKINSLSLEYSHPTFLIESLLTHLSEDETRKLLEFNNTPRIYYARPNNKKSSLLELKATLDLLGIKYATDPDVKDLLCLEGSIDGLIASDFYKAGNLILQDKGSLLVVHALDPKPGNTILDVCAAPGGKTQYIWDLMCHEGRLVAGDFFQTRIGEARRRLFELDMNAVQWIQHDGAATPIIEADRILVDAPCTSTGMIQTHPSFKWALNKERLMTMMSLQNKIIEGILVAYIEKPGTEIVFATCSILPHEGESQIDSMLSKYPNVRLISPNILGESGYRSYDCSEGVRRLFSHRHRTHGFFIARLQITN